MANELKTASVLAFERKLDPSDALLYGGDWNTRDASQNWAPITLREKSVRGTISSRKQAKDADLLKVDGSEKNANLQTVDGATLPVGADTLKVQFTLRVLAGTGTPSACNNAVYRQKLLAVVDSYVEQQSFGELAQRYAANLANARFLWRNRIGAEQVEVTVAQIKDGQASASWTFDALKHDMATLAAPDADEDNAKALADVIADGLGGKSHVLLQVTAFVRIGAGQEVFPSQELILDKGASKKSKTLYDVNDVAAIHSQKIGNAIRTIDTWYPEAGENGPIAVEPYGSVTTQGKAYRRPSAKTDFYELLDGWVVKNQRRTTDEQHFVIATLIRGGVFGESDK